MVTINQSTKQFLKKPRTLLLIILLIASVVSVAVFGLQEGLDLAGGSMIQLHLIQLSNLKNRNYETGEISYSIQNAG